MHNLNNGPTRREVEHLDQLALNAAREDQFATMERLLEQAVQVAHRLDDLPLLIEERSFLAYAQEMQGKTVEALATYSWLIGLATDPACSHLLTDASTLSNFADAFMRFVACGRCLPEMPVERLLRVVVDGLEWLERVGKAPWASGLRSQKGMLLWMQGNREGARLELEAALALRRRDPEAFGYRLEVYLLNLAEHLVESPFHAYAEAHTLVDEALESAHNPTDLAWAAQIQAMIHLKLGEPETAIQAIQQALFQVQSVESPSWIRSVYQTLGEIHRELGQLDQAAQASAQEWRLARREDRVSALYHALTDCARVRRLQARVACGLPASEASLPDHLPAEAQVALALRRTRSTRSFVRRAFPLAQRLDQASGQRENQEALEELAQVASALETWLTEQGQQ